MKMEKRGNLFGKMLHQKDKRGISPIVATVILVSLVVTLSILVWIFLGGFIKELVIKREKSVETVCIDDVEIAAEVVDLSDNKIIVSNEGNVPIAGVNIELRAKGTARLKFYNCPLAIGDASTEVCPQEFTVNTDFADLIGICDKVTITPVILGTGQKSGRHQRSACDVKATTFPCP